MAGFDQRQLRLLHCWHNWKTKRYECPSENTIRRALHGIDPLGFDRIVGDWTRAHNKVGALAIDGKTLKACLDADRRQTTLVAAVAHGDGAPLAQMPVPAGTNETATARNLLDLLPPLDGVLATFDAAHTNGETARKVVIEKGGDYPVPTYQWQFSTNGSTYVNIGGATSPGYLIISSALTDIGFYRVMASNSQGTNYSGTVTLGCIDLKMLAAVYLTGPIGGNYRIDAASVLTPSNWVTLTNISLPTQPYIHVDYTSATNKQQFYRAVPQ